MALQKIKNNTHFNYLSEKRRVYILVTSFISGLIIFIIAYLGMKNSLGVGIFDQSVLSWMVNNRNDFINIIAKLITALASPWFLFTVVTLIVILWSLLKREVIRPALLAGSMLIAALTSETIKTITMNQRPSQINMIPQFELNYSFPSGHTIAAAVLLLVLGYLIYSRNFSRKLFFTWVTLAIFGTGIIAFTRLYLGYHWLTDVFASIGLSLIILSIIVFCDMIIGKYYKK